MRATYQFLSSVWFALLLIALVALSVITGTVIEAVTQSHQRALLLTYQSPSFLALMVGFFVNILLSALRRWPWRRAHLPFLLAHLGLLMIISGQFVKSHWGLQANMNLLEGSASREVLLPNTYGLHIEGEGAPSFEIIGYSPHSKEENELFIKGEWLYIEGMPPLQLGVPKEVELADGKRWIVRGEVVDAIDQVEPPVGNQLLFVKDLDGQQALITPFGTNYFDLDEVIAVDGGHGGYGVIAHVPSHALTPSEMKAGYWACLMADEAPLTPALIYQIMEVEKQLPDPPEEKSEQEITATLLRAGYVPHGTSVELFTPLTRTYTPLTPGKKLEALRPAVTARIGYDVITLGYDPTGCGIKWPVMGGDYMVRFQPSKQQIPYTIRLHEGRQINYPGTKMPKAYQADISVTDSKGREIFTTLAMNKVYSTWDGYRFYLSNIHPSEPVAARRIQITVNRDPAKYFLTYPGGLIVFIGSLMLFATRRKR